MGNRIWNAVRGVSSEWAAGEWGAVCGFTVNLPAGEYLISTHSVVSASIGTPLGAQRIVVNGASVSNDLWAGTLNTDPAAFPLSSTYTHPGGEAVISAQFRASQNCKAWASSRIDVVRVW